MQNIRIEKPCTEDWNQMDPTDKGAFCQKYAMEVFDFTNKKSSEIKDILRSQLGQRVCGRFKVEQQDAMNEEFETWKFNGKRSMQRAMVFSLVVVFGLTLFSYTNKSTEENLLQIRESVTAVIANGVSDVKNQKADEIHEMGIVPYTEDDLIDEVEKPDHIIDGEFIISEKEEVQVVEIKEHLIEEEYVLGGAVMISPEYVDYLLEPVSEEDPLRQIELDENGLEIPKEFGAKVYPNPATTETTFEFKLPQDSEQVSIYLFDMNGSMVRSVYSGMLKKGTRTFTVDLLGLTSGTYLINIVSPEFKETVRLNKL